MTAYGLTRRQLNVLTFIRTYIARHGVSPSYDDIRRHLGLSSKSSIVTVVSGLVERGHIGKLNGRRRSLTLTEPNEVESFAVTDPKLRAQLTLYCLATDQDPQAVIHDAVALFIDADTDHSQAQEGAPCPTA